MVITILASGYRALFPARCGNRGLCPLIPSCCTFPWGSLLSHTFSLVLGKHLRRTLGRVWSFLCDCPLSGTLPYRFCSAPWLPQALSSFSSTHIPLDSAWTSPPCAVAWKFSPGSKLNKSFVFRHLGLQCFVMWCPLSCVEFWFFQAGSKFCLYYSV